MVLLRHSFQLILDLFFFETAYSQEIYFFIFVFKLFIIFSFFFVIDTLLSKLEGNFFIENYPVLFNIGSGFLETMLITIGIFYLWKQEDVIINAKQKVINYFRSRSLLSCRLGKSAWNLTES